MQSAGYVKMVQRSVGARADNIPNSRVEILVLALHE